MFSHLGAASSDSSAHTSSSSSTPRDPRDRGAGAAPLAHDAVADGGGERVHVPPRRVPRAGLVRTPRGLRRHHAVDLLAQLNLPLGPTRCEERPPGPGSASTALHLLGELPERVARQLLRQDPAVALGELAALEEVRVAEPGPVHQRVGPHLLLELEAELDGELHGADLGHGDGLREAGGRDLVGHQAAAQLQLARRHEAVHLVQRRAALLVQRVQLRHVAQRRARLAPHGALLGVAVRPRGVQQPPREPQRGLRHRHAPGEQPLADHVHGADARHGRHILVPYHGAVAVE
mmetsp:Transcript_25835/g.63575  ORF Transcript_25835/g.63575 Transcript_25835/m.63575 type:complete len:291 (+) Transcript_25835:285-1157(+)